MIRLSLREKQMLRNERHNFQMTDKLGLDEMVEDMDGKVESMNAIVYPIFDAAMKVIAGYVGLIGVSALLGLLLGCLCMRREQSANRGRTRITGCGATCLMLSVFMSAVIILFILLLGSVFLLLGGNITITCKTIQEVTLMEHLIENEVLFNGDSLGQVVLGNDEVNISVKEFMDNCREGGTLFGSFDIHKMINFTDIFEPSEFVPELEDDMYDSISDTIQDINVFDVAFLNDISSKLSFSSNDTVDGIQSLKDEIEDFDLLQLSGNMTRVANDIPDPEYSASYRSIAQTLGNVHKVTQLPLLQAIDNLELRLDDLGMAGNEIKEAISELNSTLNEMQWFIQNDAVDLMFESIDNFLDKMVEVPDDFISNILHTLAADVGQCQIIGDIYDSITGSICVYFLDGFNSLWAGLYVAGLTFIFLMIANCRLGQYFRKPNARPTQSEDNRNYNAGWSSDVAIPMYTFISPWNHRNANNNSIVFGPLSRIQRIKDYLVGARSRYSTGSQSPQLLRINQLSDRLMSAREGRERSAANRGRLQLYHSVQANTVNVPKQPWIEIKPSSGIEDAEETLQVTASFHNQDSAVDTTEQCDCLHLNSSEDSAYPHSGFSTFKKNHVNEFDLVPLPAVSDDYPLWNRMKRMKKNLPPVQNQTLPTNSMEFNGLLQSYDKEESVLHKCCVFSEPSNRNMSENAAGVELKDANESINNNYLQLAGMSISDGGNCEQQPRVRHNTRETFDYQSQLTSDMVKITCALCRHTSQEMEHFDEPQREARNTNTLTVAPCSATESVMSSPVAEQEATDQIRPADSFEAHLNDFETACINLSNNFRQENDEVQVEDANRNNEDVGKVHRDKTLDRSTYKVLKIKVRPYAEKAALEALHGEWWDDSIESLSPASVAEVKIRQVCCDENFNQNAKDSHQPSESALQYEGHGHMNTSVSNTDKQENIESKAEKYIDNQLNSLQQLATNAFCSSPNYSHFNFRQNTGIRNFNDQHRDLFHKNMLDLETEVRQLVDLANSVDKGCGKTPESLVILSSKAIVEGTSNTVLPLDPVQGYVSATTEKNRDRVTYM